MNKQLVNQVCNQRQKQLMVALTNMEIALKTTQYRISKRDSKLYYPSDFNANSLTRSRVISTEDINHRQTKVLKDVV